MVKKIFIVILILLVLGGGVAAYYFFFTKKETGNTGGFSVGDLFPFVDNGTTGGTTTEPDPTPPEPEPTNPTEPSAPSKLKLVARGPIAGAYVYDTTRPKPNQDPNAKLPNGKPKPIEIENATAVRFTESANGHTSEGFLDQISTKKLTNTTIPKIYESFFAGKGSSVLLRYADDKEIIKTFSGVIPTESTQSVVVPTQIGGTTAGTTAGTSSTDTTTVIVANTELKGNYLPENILSFSVSPDTTKIFTLQKDEAGVTGFISLPDGSKKVNIFTQMYTEWLTEWPTQKIITFATKPSYKTPGYFYAFDVDKKLLKKIFGGVPGMTALMSPDGKTVLFSSSKDKGITSNVYAVASREVFALPGATTLPEKCVWQSEIILYCAVPTFMPSAQYPDDWYQGAVSFNDQIYRINIKTFESVVIVNPATLGLSMDATRLAVDANNTYLVFINKRDGSLWSLDVRPPEIPPTTPAATQ